jgi:hypothetical protein
MERMIANGSKPDDLALDLSSGSGITVPSVRRAAAIVAIVHVLGKPWRHRE